MKTFRSIVEAELSTKEGRALVLSYINNTMRPITDLAMSYERVDELQVFNRGRVDVEITNYVICKQFRKESETRDGEIIPSISVEYKVPVVSKTSFYVSDKDGEENPVKSAARRSYGEVTSVTIDGKALKMDKKTSTQLINRFKNVKIKGVTPTDFATKERAITSKMLIQYPEVTKEVEKSKKAHAKEQLERQMKADKEKWDAIKKIVKKEKVDAKRIAVSLRSPSEHDYIIFDKEGFDYAEASSEIMSYDTETWAIDRGYRDAEEQNKRTIERMRKIGTGVFHYQTSPGGNTTQASIQL